jgi:flagellar protein FliO/FliZ
MTSLRRRALAAALTGFVCALTIVPPALAGVQGPHENTPLNLPSAGSTHAGAAPSAGGGLTKTFVGLAIVVAVIYGLYWILRQVKSSKESTASGTGLRSHASIPLGPNRSLHLVRAGKELVLVGAGEHSVSAIRAYTEDEARAVGLLGDDDDLSDDGAPAKAPSRSAGLVEAVRKLTVRR